MRTRLAPAKVNLYLHVAAPDSRGYHPLESLVAFADVGDRVDLLPVETEGSASELTPLLSLYGPFGRGLSTGEDNLIMKAVRRFEVATDLSVHHRIALHKNLPIASGIGGGSADAGAVLHLLREAYAPDLSDEALQDIAASIGADGVMCLWARSSLASGYGEVLAPAILPAMDCVLINPLVECSTGSVYKGYDTQGQFSALKPVSTFSDKINIDEIVEILRYTRNDLQAPAIRLQPVIAEVIQSLEAQPETLLARMSGSGATCFALCATPEKASALSDRMQALWPSAWVRSCTLS